MLNIISTKIFSCIKLGNQLKSEGTKLNKLVTVTLLQKKLEQNLFAALVKTRGTNSCLLVNLETWWILASSTNSRGSIIHLGKQHHRVAALRYLYSNVTRIVARFIKKINTIAHRRKLFWRSKRENIKLRRYIFLRNYIRKNDFKTWKVRSSDITWIQHSALSNWLPVYTD